LFRTDGGGVSELLYLDTARLGRMSPGAVAAHRDFVTLAGDEGGGLYFDRFLSGGLQSCPSSFQSLYPGLAEWEGVGRLKSDLRSLAGGHHDLPVLLATRSIILLRFAVRFLFHPCRNVLSTDLDWPPYATELSREAERSGRNVTRLAIRNDILSGRLTESELVDVICDQFSQAKCDGLYLTAVSNIGVRFPTERIVRRLETNHTVRAVVIDGAQEFCQLPSSLASSCCDLYLTGTHKWLCAYHPLGIAFYGRERSRERVQTMLAHMISSREIDDQLLRFTSRLEMGAVERISETVNITPLFSAQGAVAHARRSENGFRVRSGTLRSAAEVAGGAGWIPLLPHTELRSGILLLQAERQVVRGHDPETLRSALRESGIAATAYPDGLLRLSMLPAGWRSGELEHLCNALKLIA
jgi:selenocysteine lyase/cysteine desulfurase